MTVRGKHAVKIARLDPVGNYAVKIVFDDGHDTGLYTWTYLRELGENATERWQAYLVELKTKGFSQ